jgi:hypothetical protein
MQRQYRFVKKTNDYGDVSMIAMILNVSDGTGKTATLKAMHVLGESDKMLVDAMSDADLLNYTKKTLDNVYKEQDIIEALNPLSRATETQGA